MDFAATQAHLDIAPTNVDIAAFQLAESGGACRVCPSPPSLPPLSYFRHTPKPLFETQPSHLTHALTTTPSHLPELHNMENFKAPRDKARPKQFVLQTV